MNKSSSKKLFIICGVFALLAIALTLVVKFIDVRPAGLTETPVGLAGFNETVRNLFPYGSSGINDFWYTITKYSGYALFLPVAFFVILGFVQLIKRKSFKKVDRELKLLALFYVAVGAVYIFFEKLFIVNYRPVLIDGELEASYPSSHTLFAITLCGSAILLVKYLLKLKHAKLVSFALALLALVTVVGRLLSGVHWATDILGGILIGATLVMALFVAIKKSISPTAKTETA